MMVTKTDWTEAEELACKILELDQDSADSGEIEQALYDKYEISFEAFHELADRLLDFTVPQKTMFGDKYRQAFVELSPNGVCAISIIGKEWKPKEGDL